MSDSNAFGFSQFVPGFDFLKQLSQTPAVSPQAQHWIAPTLDPEEIEKRIQELKTVMFWLEQNSKAVGASVQALEVQLMTLKTLKGMNLSMSELAKSMEIKPSMFTPSKAEAPAPEAASPFSWTPKPDSAASAPREPAPSSPSNWPFTPAQSAQSAKPTMPAKPASEQSAAPPAPEPTTANDQSQVPPTSGVAPDPMLWWAQLSQQFQTIASKTLTDIQNAQKAQADLAAKTAAAQASPVTSPSAAKVQPRTKPAAAPLSKAAKVNKVNKAKKAPLKTPAPNPERAASPSRPSPAAETTPHKVSNKAAKKSSSKSSNKSSNKATSKTSKKAPTPAKSAGASSASSKAQPKPRVNPSAFKGLDTLF